MKRMVVALAVTAAMFGGMTANTQAAPHKGDPPCVVNPSSVAVDQAYTVSATGLPTSTPVYLIVQSPAGSTTSRVYVSSDGTWTGTDAATAAGTWSYTFSGVLLNNKYGTVSSCSVQVS